MTNIRKTNGQTFAGWAEVDITPEPGVPLGGRGPQFKGIERIVDPLSAQALILEDRTGSSMAIISLDLVGIGTTFSFEVRNSIAVLTGIPFESIILNFSHTHSGPMTILDKYPVSAEAPGQLVDYEKKLADLIRAVVLEAHSNRRPVVLSWFSGTTGIGMNRRRKREDGEVEMRPDPDGEVVRDIWGLDIADAAGDGPRCILFSAACHAVAVYGWQWAGCSADFPGAARDTLRERYGAGVHVQFLQGFGGNARPARLADLETAVFRASTARDHLEIGSALAGDVSRAIDNASRPLDLSLKVSAGRFRVFGDRERMLPADHWREMASSTSEVERNFGRYWFDTIKNGKPVARCIPWEAGLVEFGTGLSVAWLAGEVCAEWLPLLRKWLDNDRLFGIGYCQDLPGYLPTAKLIEEGGYEAERSNWYRKTGPAPFEKSLEREARALFSRMSKSLH